MRHKAEAELDRGKEVPIDHEGGGILEGPGRMILLWGGGGEGGAFYSFTDI